MVRRRRSALVAGLATAAAVTASVLTGGLVQPAGATAAAPYRPALEVTLETLSPAAVADGDGGDPVSVGGTVTNVDDDTWLSVNLYPVVSPAPMTTEAELAEAAAAEAESFVGERITDPGPYDTIEQLAPGESATFFFTVSRDQLALTTSGVYWFGVHAMGETAQDGRDDVADGRARTFLSYQARGTRGSVRTAIVVPLRRYLPYAADGSLDNLARLTRDLEPGGRMRSLVDFAAAAGDQPVTLLVDPAVPDVVRRIASGNPARSLTPTDPPPTEGGDDAPPSETPSAGSDQASPAPTQTPGESDGDQGDGGEGGTGQEQPELTPEQVAGAEAAATWLGRFAEAVDGDEVLALPYGDLDVPAAAAHDPGAYDLARNRPGRVLGDLTAADGGPASVLSAAGSPSGHLDGPGFDLLDDDTTVLLSDRAFTEQAPGVAEVADHTVAVTSSAAAAGGPGPGDRLTTLQLRQRILAQALVRSQQPGRPPLVVVMPHQWQPDDGGAFFSGLEVPWIEAGGVADATSRDGRQVDVADVDYPQQQVDRQLGAATFDSFRSVVEAGATLQNLLTLNSEVSTTVTDEALASVSYGARAARPSAQAGLTGALVDLRGELAGVTINAGPGVTLSGSEGGFSAVVTNELDQPVTVGIVATSTGDDVEIAPVEPVTIEPQARTTVVLDARIGASGVTNVTLSLTDLEGNPLGASDRLPIRSAQVSDVIWLIIGTGVGLLFLAIVVRLVRRVRRSRGSVPTIETVPDAQPLGTTT